MYLAVQEGLARQLALLTELGKEKAAQLGEKFKVRVAWIAMGIAMGRKPHLNRFTGLVPSRALKYPNGILV